MKIIKSLDEIDKEEKLLLTIGNFDGVHLGHQNFLRKLKGKSLDKKLKLAVITFVPHPHFVLLKNDKHYLLSTYLERRRLISDLGVDFLIENKFSKEFSNLSPLEFWEKHIDVNHNIKHFAAGHDFSFGKNKNGDFELMSVLAKKSKIDFSIEDEYSLDGQNISSTKIRLLLLNDNIEKANYFLGREFSLKGEVVRGDGRGKTIGLPTANLAYDDNVILPKNGIYVTKTKLNNEIYISLTNIGTNPTFTSSSSIKIETNILNFDRDIYGDSIEILFFKKIREEKSFKNSTELMATVKDDIAKTLQYFKQ